MTDTERAVLEAAFDLAGFQAGYDSGAPIHEQQIQAKYAALMSAIADHAAENDGHLPISEDTQ